jgi:hypothetical protein
MAEPFRIQWLAMLLNTFGLTERQAASEASLQAPLQNVKSSYECFGRTVSITGFCSGTTRSATHSLQPAST